MTSLPPLVARSSRWLVADSRDVARSDPLPTHLFRLQASVALGAGFGFFAALPGVGLIIGGVFDVHRSLWAGAVVSVTAGVGLCVLGAAHWRRSIPDRLIEWAPGLLAVILALQSAAELVTTGDAQMSVLLLLGIVSTGATVPRWWVLAVADAILAGAYLFALTTLGHGPIEPAPVAALIISVLMGTALYTYHSSGRRQLHALTVRIGELTLRDPLTGLLNRRGLTENLPVTDAGACPITAAICLDVNGFKAINDELGHTTGDAILCTLAERLSRVVRRGDIVARTGGGRIRRHRRPSRRARSDQPAAADHRAT
jgi:hypothetical protein